ncbi:MAG: hypothetical protein OXC31_19585 [Spirochaetaceae bacterium]|nr:hypothetical protein [Spirochaetaceae bacterium]
MNAVLLAAGYGIPHPLAILDTPKALIEVGGRALIHRLQSESPILPVPQVRVTPSSPAMRRTETRPW